MPTSTLIYELQKPTVSGDANNWGGMLDNALDAIDLALSVPRVQRTAPTVGATTTIAIGQATVHKFTVSQVTTIVLSGWAVDTTPGKWAQRVWLQITNGGAFAVTWPGAITWLSGATPVLKTSGVDIIELFSVDNGTTVYGVHHAVVDALPANIVASAAIAALAVTTAKIADANVTAVKAADKERCLVTKAGNQSIASGSDVAVIWDGTESYDTATLHDPASNNTRLVVPASWAGSEAFIVAQITWASMGGNASSDVWIRKNGATELARVHVDTGSGGGAPRQQCMAFDNAPTTSDYYEIMVRQASGISELVAASGSWARLARIW